MEEKIGVLGGCFNPVHNGHLILARDAAEELGLARVLCVPCRIPPHKSLEELAPADDRVAMLRLAVRGEPRFAVVTCEIERPGVSYSIDTLRRLQGEHPGARLLFLIGSDTLPELPTWKDIAALAALCEFAVMERPPEAGTPAGPAARPPVPGLVVRAFRGHCIDISSTDIRRRIAAGRSLRYLVPEAVEAYIIEHGLYRSQEAHSSKH